MQQYGIIFITTKLYVKTFTTTYSIRMLIFRFVWFRFDMAYKLERNTQNYVYFLIWHTQLKEIQKIMFIWSIYKKENPRYCLMTSTYIASNCCTFSDKDFGFDQHCKAQVATVHTQRNQRIPILQYFYWRSLLQISYRQRSNLVVLKTFQSIVKCMTLI